MISEGTGSCLYIFAVFDISYKSNYNDTKVKRSKIRYKLACKRIFDLRPRQKHENLYKISHLLGSSYNRITK